jgi:hypothetical protein
MRQKKKMAKICVRKMENKYSYSFQFSGEVNYWTANLQLKGRDA